MRPGFEHNTSWFLVGFISATPRQELCGSQFYPWSGGGSLQPCEDQIEYKCQPCPNFLCFLKGLDPGYPPPPRQCRQIWLFSPQKLPMAKGNFLSGNRSDKGEWRCWSRTQTVLNGLMGWGRGKSLKMPKIWDSKPLSDLDTCG